MLGYLVSGMIALGALLIYGEHLFAAPDARSWAHYAADATQGLLLWILLGALATLLQRCVWRSAALGACAWFAAENALTIAAGVLGATGAPPEQWHGLIGQRMGIPLAACGLTGFVVFVLSMWWSSADAT